MTRPCLEENEIVDLVTGNLDAEAAAEAEAHIDTCNACRLVLIELARVFELRASSLPAAPHETTERSEDEAMLPLVLQPRALVRGTAIGRYVVLEVLGTGAMGIVYAAYDPELDRKVALKLLRDRKVDDGHRERLLREARATAKLAHPNVVVVHDVGTHEGAVFMAMEFVEGGTLADWQREERDHDAIVRAYVDAARGLEAAHAVGLVHRDFKPANVLVGLDERVRVTDFGLARLGELTGSVDDEAYRTLDASPSDAELTKTGAIIGTPAYMSPEQFRGEPADARSDQFSFCVALYEALCDERPFAGKSFAELSAHVCTGQVQQGDAFAALPRPIRAVLLQGMRVDPAERFADMGALLEALQPEGGSTRLGPALVGGSVAAVLGAFGIAMLPTDPPPDPCADEQAAFAEVWSDARRSSLRDQLAGSGHAYADDVAARVLTQLDAYSESWSDAYGPACAVSMSSAEAVCLQDRRRDLEQLLAALEQGGAPVAEFAVQAVERLKPAIACVGGEGALLPTPTPPAAVADVVARLRERLALSEALYDTRQYDEALEVASAVGFEAQGLAFAPVQAEAALARGRALGSSGRIEEAETAFSRAVRVAWASGHERAALEAAIELVFASGVELDAPAVGRVWADYGEASLKRLGGSARVEGLVAEALGALAQHQRDFPEAKRQFERSLGVRETFLPESSTVLGVTLSRLAGTEISMGDHVQGLEHATRALDLYKAAVGDRHPTVMRAYSLQGTALLQLGRLEEAAVALREALAIGEVTLGVDNPALADIHGNFASLASRQGRHAEAEAAYLKVLDAQMAKGGLENPVVGIILHNLGNVAFRDRAFDRATDYLERAIEARTVALGPEHPRIASSLATLTSVAVGSGRCDDGVRHAERALRLLEGAEVSASQRVHVQGNYADALRCAGETAEAVKVARDAATAVAADPNLARMRYDLEEILADAEFDAGNFEASETAALAALDAASAPVEKAGASFRVARVAVRRDRPKAVAMARTALDEARTSDKAEIEAFLEAHGS
ncbi:MAG: serine/threonine-protein kinase [Myxococcota bacterium]